ncbi:MAG TPA: phosphatidylserine synthase [Campylobacterales bacterium]|nr:phosphatidylserine synthase [Campylobacterales bacterium]
MFLYDKASHFNIANLVTFANITAGLVAMYFIQQGDYFTAIVLAWIGGAFDIMDGKLARKYNLSCEFGIQIDSFADFISFVVMPAFLLFYSLQKAQGFETLIAGIVFIYYIISGLRRLIEFNIKSEEGEVAKYFEGVPTPLGAILLWLLYLIHAYGIVSSIYVILILAIMIAYLLNSKVRIPHP